MKTKMLALFLLAGRLGCGGGGYRYYAPPPPPPVAYYAPPVAPAPAGYGAAYVDGYYYPDGPRWGWRPGYWAPRPYAGAYWVGPRYDHGYYHAGYWRR